MWGVLLTAASSALFAAFLTWVLWLRRHDNPPERGTVTDIRDLRHEALHLAVDLFSHRSQDNHDEGHEVVRAAGVFTRWLTAPLSP